MLRKVIGSKILVHVYHFTGELEEPGIKDGFEAEYDIKFVEVGGRRQDGKSWSESTYIPIPARLDVAIRPSLFAVWLEHLRCASVGPANLRRYQEHCILTHAIHRICLPRQREPAYLPVCVMLVLSSRTISR